MLLRTMAERQLVMFLKLAVLIAYIFSVNAEDGGGHEEYPFRITRVTKTEGRTAYVVRAEYEADAKPIVYLTSASGIPTQVTHGHTQMGLVEVRVPKATDDQWGYDTLSFVCPNLGVVQVRLNLTGSSSAMEVPPIHFHVQQGKDITFQPGGDIELDVSLRADGDIELDDLFISVLLKSEDEDNEVQRYYLLSGEAPVTFEMFRFGGTARDRTATFRLNPSGVKRDIEGILEFTSEMKFDCSSYCLVHSVIMPHHQIKFYREDHAGPFPSGFIGFIRDDRVNLGTSQVYCGHVTDKPCFVGCEVAGDHPQAVQLTGVGSNHDDSQAHAEAVTSITDYTASAYIYENPHDAIPSQSDFRCTARSSTTEITQMRTVNFVTYPKIDRVLSQIATFEDGSLKATCVATGKPVPDVGLFPEGSDVYPDSSEFNFTRVDEWTTRVELVIPDAYNFTFVECSASNNPEVGDYYRMYVEGALPPRVRYFLYNDVVTETPGA